MDTGILLFEIGQIIFNLGVIIIVFCFLKINQLRTEISDISDINEERWKAQVELNKKQGKLNDLFNKNI